MSILSSKEDVIRVLSDSKVIAVIGFHRDPGKPAYYVPEYLDRNGYTVIPVNPALAARGESYFGHAAVSTVAELTEPVDVVEIFRRSDKVYQHLQDILSMQPLPKVVWMQQGIRDDEVAHQLSAVGIEVIQDRCMLADHRMWL
ncbi:CoA-binding protein [Deinococcus sp. KNUC1210]|uniref:CoA-binding protein n=1 Tax=Deinococcus sp. KNUC1210 TaxID=2917691 RepID=UPI001EF0B6E7|nr:CoA-binding protein [Deinococcus sp. KNUC1210]ULH14586.1 CoA-binding protein [Deinococcus sp. KNUC1210]